MRRCEFLGILLAAPLTVAPAAGQTEQKLKYQDLPLAVRTAFEKQFRGARILGVSSEVEGGGTVYEIECEWRTRHHDITFRPDGALVSTEETIPMSEVPAAVSAALRREFPGAEVTRAEKITEGGAVSYEFQLKGANKREVKYSSDGRLIGSE
ncbi:MAG: PepSY-like domain-containing protein [Bryobacteraceae bacterium]